MRRFKPAGVFLVCATGLLALAACGTQPTIATDVTYCCEAVAGDVATFRVEFEDTPEFLKPMLRDEASVVLGSKGLAYTEGDAHAILVMTYVDKTVEQDGEDLDAWERSAPAGGVRFVAQVKVELRNSVTSELIWAGSMQRIHNVYEGSYMHEAPARAAIRTAFMEMFADYPDRRLETGYVE